VKTIRSFVGWVADHPIRFLIWFIISCIFGGALAYFDMPWPWCVALAMGNAGINVNKFPIVESVRTQINTVRNSIGRGDK